MIVIFKDYSFDNKWIVTYWILKLENCYLIYSYPAS